MNDKIIEPRPIDCPFCPSEHNLELLQEERTLTVKNEEVKGMYWFYKCKSCNEQFTTTASDTESLKNFKKEESKRKYTEQSVDEARANYYEDKIESLTNLLAKNENEKYSDMQYYMEYCKTNGYVTPMDWISKYKNF